MTFRELTELQEKLRNAAHTSAIMHRVETDGQNQLDHSRRWIVAGDRLRPRWIAAGDGWQEMDLRRWISGDGSRDRWQSVSFLYEDIEVMRSYTNHEITTLISNYEFSMERRYASIQSTRGMAPLSTIHTTIQRCQIKQLHAQVSMLNIISNEIPTQLRWSRVTQLQWRYRTSWSRTRLVFDGATIFKRGGWQCGNHNNPYREQLPYRKCRNKAPWNAFTTREG